MIYHVESDLLDRVTTNLTKVSVFLGLIAAGLLYAGWVELPSETGTTGLRIVRVCGISVTQEISSKF